MIQIEAAGVPVLVKGRETGELSPIATRQESTYMLVFELADKLAQWQQSVLSLCISKFTRFKAFYAECWNRGP